MKMLYIGPNVEKIKTGGDSVNKRNEILLKQIFNENFNTYYIENPVNTFFQKINGYLGGVNKTNVIEIIRIIYEKDIDCVFLSQSFYGKLCYKLRKEFPNLMIITFYHNIEKHYAREYVRTSGVAHYPFYILASYNECLTIKNSNLNFVLNERDAQLMKTLYGVESDFYLPVSYEDVFDKTKISTISNDPVKILFVGTAFFGNLPGVEFFIKDVMPYINAELIIVGKGMDQYKEKFEISSNIKVYGYVEDLSALYYNSSLVIAPIFSGGGMKTKIAEALMYGKTIVGTKEAFEGYKRIENVTYECNNAIEFINCIKKMEYKNSPEPFNVMARKLYENNYDNKVLKSGLNDFFLNNLNI